MTTTHNHHGGARPGAGRPRKKPAPFDGDDAGAFLRAVMRGEIEPAPAQIQAAKALLRLGEAGVKAERQREGERAAGGKFRPRPAPPRLIQQNERNG
jgi:hypothetical protein